MTLEEYREHSTLFEADVFKVLDLKTALKARKGIGAPSPANVGAQITRWQKKLRAEAAW
jgi:argininosuccinate lyase